MNDEKKPSALRSSNDDAFVWALSMTIRSLNDADYEMFMGALRRNYVKAKALVEGVFSLNETDELMVELERELSTDTKAT